MGKELLRLVVVGLPALLLLASLAVLLLSVPAWGAGAHAGLPDWMPTAAGVVLGLPAAIIAGICLHNVLLSTNASFSVTPLLLVFGLLTLPIAIATETAVAVGVADPATYDRLLEPDNGSRITSDAALDSGPVSPEGFMAGTIVISLFLNGVVAISAVIYASAVTVSGGQRFERTPGEFDAIDELLRGRHGSRSNLR
jgi:hypothetical protein